MIKKIMSLNIENGFNTEVQELLNQFLLKYTINLGHVLNHYFKSMRPVCPDDPAMKDAYQSLEEGRLRDCAKNVIALFKGLKAARNSEGIQKGVNCLEDYLTGKENDPKFFSLLQNLLSFYSQVNSQPDDIQNLVLGQFPLQEKKDLCIPGMIQNMLAALTISRDAIVLAMEAVINDFISKSGWLNWVDENFQIHIRPFVLYILGITNIPTVDQFSVTPLSQTPADIALTLVTESHLKKRIMEKLSEQLSSLSIFIDYANTNIVNATSNSEDHYNLTRSLRSFIGKNLALNDTATYIYGKNNIDCIPHEIGVEPISDSINALVKNKFLTKQHPSINSPLSKFSYVFTHPEDAIKELTRLLISYDPSEIRLAIDVLYVHCEMFIGASHIFFCLAMSNKTILNLIESAKTIFSKKPRTLVKLEKIMDRKDIFFYGDDDKSYISFLMLKLDLLSSFSKLMLDLIKGNAPLKYFDLAIQKYKNDVVEIKIEDRLTPLSLNPQAEEIISLLLEKNVVKWQDVVVLLKYLQTKKQDGLFKSILSKLIEFFNKSNEVNYFSAFYKFFVNKSLVSAATHGDIQFVLAFLDEELVNKNYLKMPFNDNGNTLIHYAAKGDHSQFIHDFIDLTGTDILLQKNNGGWAPIHVAAELGFINVIQTMYNIIKNKYAIQKAREFLLNPGGQFNETIVHIACVYGQPKIIEYLHNLGILKTNFFSPNTKDVRPYHFAAIYGHFNIIQAYIKLELETFEMMINDFIVHVAAMNNQADFIYSLYEALKGNERLLFPVNRMEGTPFFTAVKAGHFDVINTFLDILKILKTESKGNPLELVPDLLKPDKYGKTVVHKIFENKKWDMFLKLLNLTIPVSELDQSDNTLINFTHIKFLLEECGFTIDYLLTVEINSGKTITEVALENNQCDFIKDLLLHCFNTSFSEIQLIFTEQFCENLKAKSDIQNDLREFLKTKFKFSDQDINVLFRLPINCSLKRM